MKSGISSNPTAIRSRNQIIHALFDLMQEISYQEITIKEIAFKANVVRRTFYRHFATKEDVIRSYLDDLFSKYISKLMAFEEIDTYLIAKVFFETALQHREILLLLRENEITIPVDLLENYHRELGETFSIRYECLDLSEEFIAYANAHFAGGLLNVLNKWIDEGMALSPEEMAELFDYISPNIESVSQSKSNVLE